MKFTIREQLSGISGLVASFFIVNDVLLPSLLFMCFAFYWLWREEEIDTGNKIKFIDMLRTLGMYTKIVFRL